MPEIKTIAGREIEYKWIALSVTTIGSLMAAIDSTIVILGIPEMMVELHADMIAMIWVMMGYLLVSTIFLLTFGRVADMFGRVRMYNLGFVVFTIGSVLCGISGDASHLILSRFVQGIGAGMMIVNSVAILTEAFPLAQRGLALGINSITWAAGGIIGPVLGGFILSVNSWRWIFFINVPIGIIGAAWGYAALKELSERKKGERFDIPGAVSFSLSLVSLLLALTLGIQYGWLSAPILLLFVVFAIMLAVFLWWEQRTENPVLHLSLFRNRVYSFSVLAAMMQSLAIFAVNFLVVFYLIGVRGYTPLSAAMLLIPLPAFLAIMAPLSGLVSDRIGARVPATIGLLIQSMALLSLTYVTYSTSYLRLAASLAIMGVGGGMFYAPNVSAAMSAAPSHRLGIASATLFTLRQTGMVTSYALSLAVAAASLPHNVMLQLFVGTNVALGSELTKEFVFGMHNAFYVSMGLCLVSAVLSFARGKQRLA